MASEQGGSLRLRLNEMTDRLASFEEVIAAEAWRKRNLDDKKMQLLTDLVADLEALLADEVRQRMESSKFLQQLGSGMIDEASRHLTDAVTESVTRQAEMLEKLVSHCERLETKVEALHDPDAHDSLAALHDKVHHAAQELQDFEESYQHQWLPQLDEAHRKCMLQLRQIKKATHEQLEKDTHEFQLCLDDIRKRKESVEQEAVESNTMYKNYVPQEAKAFKTAIAQEALIREETDDALVRALNEYNTALHKGFSTVLRG